MDFLIALLDALDGHPHSPWTYQSAMLPFGLNESATGPHSASFHQPSNYPAAQTRYLTRQRGA